MSNFDMNYAEVDAKPCVCKGCVPPKRCPGCHSVCQEYIKWREDYDVQKNQRDNDKWIRSLGSRGN